MTQSFGFLGGGKIASALAGGLLAARSVEATHLAVCDALPEQTRRFAEKFGARAVNSPEELADRCQVVLLCVKPNDAATALASMKQALQGKLLISVAAGLSVDWLSQHTGTKVKICRAMPNTAAEIRQSVTALCFSENATAEDREVAREAFAAVGEVFLLEEKFFDAVVGVSGSGPAYACLLIEAMSEGATRAGLPREVATRLAALAVRGAAGLVVETSTHPALLREAISSPGGTTLAGLAELEKGGLRYHGAEAVLAAARRSAELAESAKSTAARKTS